MDFVKYAGASGDFARVHVDVPYALSGGHRDVFGQGMFSAGFLSNAVTSWVGVGAVKEFETQFRAQLFPGDTLTASAAVTEVDGTGGEERATLDLEVENQDGDAVVVGTAVVERP
jgi:acyl dehydratase